MPDTYRDTIKELSDRIVEAQRPIKVLNAINWDDSIKEKFFASEFKELPAEPMRKVPPGMRTMSSNARSSETMPTSPSANAAPSLA